MAVMKKKHRLHIRRDLCKSCRLCVDFCPKDVLAMTTDRLNANGVLYVECLRPEDCIGCQLCTTICPDAVIELFQEAE